MTRAYTLNELVAACKKAGIDDHHMRGTGWIEQDELKHAACTKIFNSFLE